MYNQGTIATQSTTATKRTNGLAAITSDAVADAVADASYRPDDCTGGEAKEATKSWQR